MTSHRIAPAPFGRRLTRKLPAPLRLSAMIGASLVLWGAILIPFLA